MGIFYESRYNLYQHHDTVTAIAFQPGSHLLASAAEDGWVCLWNKANQMTQILQGATKGFSTLSWNHQGTALATAGQQGEVLMWKPQMRGKGFG
jgi:WD40 repeat protein